MNRDIKFRAWTKRWGMVYPDEEFSIDVHARKVWNDAIDQEWVELMQFTGLTDSTGKEIYEGDIVQKTYKDGQKSEKMQVVWSTIDGLWWAADLPNDEGKGQELYMYPKATIIGNIFETPELLQ